MIIKLFIRLSSTLQSKFLMGMVIVKKFYWHFNFNNNSSINWFQFQLNIIAENTWECWSIEEIISEQLKIFSFECKHFVATSIYGHALIEDLKSKICFEFKIRSHEPHARLSKDNFCNFNPHTKTRLKGWSFYRHKEFFFMCHAKTLRSKARKYSLKDFPHFPLIVWRRG